jgi:hypothetical protein
MLQRGSTIEKATGRMGWMHGRQRGRTGITMLFALSLLLAACTIDNPKYCDDNKPCQGAGMMCIDNGCVLAELGKGGSGGRKATGGTGPAVLDAGAGGAPGTGGELPPTFDASNTEIDMGPAPECTMDDQCANVPSRTVCVMGKCSPCAIGKEKGCPLESPFCTADNQCVPCGTKKAEDPAICKMPTSVCTNEGWCAECATFTDCKADPLKPLCAGPTNMPKSCVSCMTGGGSDGCKARDATKPVCLAAGNCEECGVSADCPVAAKPICLQSQCAPCTSDDQCAGRPGGPGVCLIEPDAKGGRCATDAETIYVGTTGCSDSNKGVAAMPYCSTQKAIDAINKDRRVVVVRGGPFGGFAIDKSDKSGTTPIWIVGLKNGGSAAVINPGIEAGIVIRNVTVDVRLRGLTIRGSEDIGVRAEGNATVRLNRCILESNRRGGLSVTGGAGFDVSNTVFDRNGAGGTDAGALGGAWLSPPTGNRIGRFRASTVIDNVGTGINCTVAGSQSLVGVLLSGNTAVGCKAPVESKTVGDPLFSATQPYHLTDMSPCRGQLSAGNAPFDDLDGEIRTPGQTDCGADQYKP